EYIVDVKGNIRLILADLQVLADAQVHAVVGADIADGRRRRTAPESAAAIVAPSAVGRGYGQCAAGTVFRADLRAPAAGNLQGIVPFGERTGPRVFQAGRDIAAVDPGIINIGVQRGFPPGRDSVPENQFDAGGIGRVR